MKTTDGLTIEVKGTFQRVRNDDFPFLEKL